MNDVDFPVGRVLEGIEAAAEAGLPVKVNAVVKRGVNDHGVVDMARHFRDTGHTLRFIEYMDVGLDERLAARRRRPCGRDRGADRRGLPARARRARLPGRGRAALALPRRRRRARRDLVGDAALLRRLHAVADLGRGKALHLSLRGPRHRPPRASPLRRERRGAHRGDRRRLDARRDRYQDNRLSFCTWFGCVLFTAPDHAVRRRIPAMGGPSLYLNVHRPRRCPIRRRHNQE